jgi:DNA-binding transcriptional ArsR family regulator
MLDEEILKIISLIDRRKDFAPKAKTVLLYILTAKHKGLDEVSFKVLRGSITTQEVSTHRLYSILAELTEAGHLTSRKEGYVTYYTLNPDSFQKLFDLDSLESSISKEDVETMVQISRKTDAFK